jgi:endoglucanase
VIPVIRANDPDAVVLVGTPTWSQEIDKAAQSPLPQSNVMYTLHFYAATHKDDLRNRLVSVVRGGLPVFVSEFGICDASGNGAIDQGSANSWVSTMNSLGVSWCMWSLCNKAESASIIRSSCTATSGFKSGDLTTSGKWLLQALDGSLPAGTVATGESGGGSGTQTASAKPVTFTSGNFTCKATCSNSWDAGNGKTCYQYELTIKNRGAGCSSWSVTVPFNKAISYSSGWNGTFKASGSKLTVRNASHNGTIGKGASVTGIGFQVTAGSGLKVSP